MDRSLFRARLMAPTFVAIALGILINLGMYESMIVEALHTGILFYLSGLLSLLAGLAIINLHKNIYGGRANTIVVALIIGALGAFLSFKGYLQHA
jgi:positive regulator of sigma E activity